LGLPPIDLEPPRPLLRRKIDQQGSFETTGLLETVPDPSSRGEHLILEEPIIFYLGAEALGPYNPPITDLSMPIVQVLPYKRPIVSPTTIEENVATSSRKTNISFTNVTTGGVPPPNQPSSVRATMVSTASTPGSSLIPSMVAITTPYT